MRIQTRLISLFICLAMMAAFVPASFASQQFDFSAYPDFEIDKDTMTILRYTGTDTHVVVPNGVVSLGYAFQDEHPNIQSISLPDSITRIDDNTFVGCSSLSDIDWPNHLTSIGKDALFGTPYAEKTYNGGDFAIAEGYLFNYRGAAQNLVIPEGVRVIADGMFGHQWDLYSVELPSTLEYIGTRCFYTLKFLKQVTIPKSVKRIGSESFSFCPMLTDLVFEQGCEAYVDHSAFSISGLERITFSNNLSGIGSQAFSSTPFLNQLESVDGLRIVDGYLLTAAEYNSVLTIPAGVRVARGSVFSAGYLNNVILPEGMISVSKMMFASNVSLVSVSIPSSVKVIEEYAFLGCSSLKEVVLPYGVERIEVGAFSGCGPLVRLDVPESVTYIHKWAEIIIDTTEPGAAMHVVPGSYAEAYAIANEIPYVADLPAQGASSNPSATGFVDVPEGKYYSRPVSWAVENEITAGKTKTEFQPNGICTRGQVMTFIWRGNGCPEPESMEHNFTDLNPNKFYYKAVLWAVEQGITTGKTATTFEPDSACTRSQVVTFLWRAAGNPEPKNTNNPFTDVQPNAYYYKAVLWAVENGITTGKTVTTFQPKGECTRAQIVTFLYRWMAEE